MCMCMYSLQLDHRTSQSRRSSLHFFRAANTAGLPTVTSYRGNAALPRSALAQGKVDLDSPNPGIICLTSLDTPPHFR
jgi:hypothetical protein